MAAVIGIDLGTTNTVVASAGRGSPQVLADQGRALIPSVVSFLDDGRVVVGEEARRRRLVDPTNTIYSIKRLIGRSWDSVEAELQRQRSGFILREGPGHAPMVVARGETFTLPEISAFVLRKAKQVAEKQLGAAVDRAVITVPANFNDLQRAATKVAGRVAGLEVLRILNEPTAAALAYGLGRGGSERIAVYDFGGGTFDVTLLDLNENVFEVLATAGNTFLGGDDIDALIGERLAVAALEQHGIDPRRDPISKEHLNAAAERIKIALSTASEFDEALPHLVREAGAARSVEFRITRSELESLATPLVDSTLSVCSEALGLAGLRVDDFDQVLLVGGSTRLPLVARRVKEFFGARVRSSANPDQMVAIGAAIQASALSGELSRTASRETRRSLPPPLPPKAAARAGRSEENQRSEPLRIKIPRPGGAPVATAIPHATAAMSSSKIASRAAEALKAAAAASAPGADLELDPIAVLPVVTPAAPARDSKPSPPTAGSATDEDEWLDDFVSDGSIPPDEPSLPPPEDADDEELTPVVGALASWDGSFGTADELPPGRVTTPGWAPDAPPRSPVSTPETDDPEATRRFTANPTVAAGLLDAPDVSSDSIRAPLLIDVTPLSLAVETVGGYCDRLVLRNSPVPCQQGRTFTTAEDGQTVVHVRVCQGESNRFSDNTLLGTVELAGLPPEARGSARIWVNFELDADGILRVQARDQRTGKNAEARLRLQGLDPTIDVGELAVRLDQVLVRERAS